MGSSHGRLRGCCGASPLHADARDKPPDAKTVFLLSARQKDEVKVKEEDRGGWRTRRRRGGTWTEWSKRRKEEEEEEEAAESLSSSSEPLAWHLLFGA